MNFRTFIILHLPFCYSIMGLRSLLVFIISSLHPAQLRWNGCWLVKVTSSVPTSSFDLRNFRQELRLGLRPLMTIEVLGGTAPASYRIAAASAPLTSRGLMILF